MTREYKTVLVGDSGVGKTAIARFAISGEVLSNDSPTVAAAHYLYALPNGSALSIWDTAGQERFRSLVPMYARDAVVALLVFDVTSPASFEGIEDWAHLVRGCATDCTFYVVGNKIDLAEQRRVSDDEAWKAVKTLGAESYQATSAITGEGIGDLMAMIGSGLEERAGRATRQEHALEPVDAPAPLEEAPGGFGICC
jgi:small GTP-binding protein